MAMHSAGASWSRLLAKLSGALASVIFPSDCRICESLLTTASRLPVCEGCLASFRRNPLEICDVCGVPWGVPDESDEELPFARIAASRNTGSNEPAAMASIKERWCEPSCC